MNRWLLAALLLLVCVLPLASSQAQSSAYIANCFDQPPFAFVSGEEVWLHCPYKWGGYSQAEWFSVGYSAHLKIEAYDYYAEHLSTKWHTLNSSLPVYHAAKWYDDGTALQLTGTGGLFDSENYEWDDEIYYRVQLVMKGHGGASVIWETDTYDVSPSYTDGWAVLLHDNLTQDSTSGGGPWNGTRFLWNSNDIQVQCQVHVHDPYGNYSLQTYIKDQNDGSNEAYWDFISISSGTGPYNGGTFKSFTLSQQDVTQLNNYGGPSTPTHIYVGIRLKKYVNGNWTTLVDTGPVYVDNLNN